MRVAIYIQDGTTQLVLTPESDWEKDVTAKMARDGEYDVTIKRGSFFECRGGWFRHSDYASDESLMLRMDRRPSSPPADPLERLCTAPAPVFGVDPT